MEAGLFRIGKMEITIQVREIIGKALGHVDGIVTACDFTVDAFHAACQFHPLLRSQDEDDSRHHVTEHACMRYGTVDDDRVAHDAGPGGIARAGVEDMVVADDILDEIAFIVA